MTALLQKAISEISALDESEQDQYARWLLAELEDERLWEEQFSGSLDVLEKLEKDALALHRAGKSELLDPDTL